jgi:hypothetical protein
LINRVSIFFSWDIFNLNVYLLFGMDVAYEVRSVILYCSNHILNTGLTYGTIIDTMDVVKIWKKENV